MLDMTSAGGLEHARLLSVLMKSADLRDLTLRNLVSKPLVIFA